MSKFRKKPVVIEAKRFVTNNEPTTQHMDELVLWMNQGSRHCKGWHNGTDIFIFSTTGCELIVSVGDWIIKGVNNQFFLIKNEDFLATYEPV